MSAGEGTWREVAREGDLPVGEMRHLDIGGRPIALYHCASGYFATGDICTHMRARLSDGYLEGEVVQCALHYGRFDVKTGAPLSPPCTVALPTYRVKVDAGRVLLELP